MISKPTDQQIAKLPKWAQEYITDITRERNEAVRTLNNFKDTDTPSGIWYEDTPCLGEKPGPSFIKRYIQAYAITFEHAGVKLRVNTHGDSGISLNYEDDKRMGSEIALIPTGFQQVELIARKNMRSHE